jgi:hypothetical protein
LLVYQRHQRVEYDNKTNILPQIGWSKHGEILVALKQKFHSNRKQWQTEWKYILSFSTQSRLYHDLSFDINIPIYILMVITPIKYADPP